MINKLRWIQSEDTCPYCNLALEEYLTLHTEEGECILYLWQNQRTVVIGKNQNCWKECKVNFLEEEGGYLARRLSGGGAVFHDLGNLNYTFMVRKQDYNLNRQLDVILTAVRMLGIQAEKTGRNDITVEGRKFSGNAFYKSGDCCYHHGTLLLHVNKEEMSRYLNVSKEKLLSKSVNSVKSRVVNLSEYNPEITVDTMKRKMKEAFGKVYGMSPLMLEEERIDRAAVKDLTGKFSSWEWKYGRKLPFDYVISKRFEWGDMELEIHVNEGRILDINVFSDAMDQELAEELSKALKGCCYNGQDMSQAVKTLKENGADRKVMKQDLLLLLRQSL